MGWSCVLYSWAARCWWMVICARLLLCTKSLLCEDCGKVTWTPCASHVTNRNRHCYQKDRIQLSSTISCSSKVWDLSVSQVFQLLTLNICLFIRINAYHGTKSS